MCRCPQTCAAQTLKLVVSWRPFRFTCRGRVSHATWSASIQLVALCSYTGISGMLLWPLGIYVDVEDLNSGPGACTGAISPTQKTLKEIFNNSVTHVHQIPILRKVPELLFINYYSWECILLWNSDPPSSISLMPGLQISGNTPSSSLKFKF